MAGTNDFLTFATGVGADVLTQAQYAALTTVLANGFTTGTAQSSQLNKVWRQSSIMSAVLAQMIADVSGQNVVDDGTTATILNNFLTTLLGSGYSLDTGTANTYVVTLSPAPTALVDGMEVKFFAANASTGASTLNVNGLGAVSLTKNGSTPAIGASDILAGDLIKAVYHASGNTWRIVSSAAQGATGGGNDKIFYLNGQTINSNFTVPTGENAMSAGPVTIATGVVITVSTGSRWTVV